MKADQMAAMAGFKDGSVHTVVHTAGVCDCHGEEIAVAVAVGKEVRVAILRNPSLESSLGSKFPGEDCYEAEVLRGQHEGPVRALAFHSLQDGGRGLLLATAADDKRLLLWFRGDGCKWRLVSKWALPKRVVSVQFFQNGRHIHLLAADKFGQVQICDVVDRREMDLRLCAPDRQEPIVSSDDKIALLLAHNCSTIYAMTTSPCGRYLLTGDRDEKLRVSVFPRDKPMEGAHEIQAFCFGHSAFLASIACLDSCNSEDKLCISSGGDGTLRLWNYEQGALLHTLAVANAAGEAPQIINNIVVGEKEGVACIDGGGMLYNFSIDREKRKLGEVGRIQVPNFSCITCIEKLSTSGKIGNTRFLIVGGAGEGKGTQLSLGQLEGSTFRDTVFTECRIQALTGTEAVGKIMEEWNEYAQHFYYLDAKRSKEASNGSRMKKKRQTVAS